MKKIACTWIFILVCFFSEAQLIFQKTFTSPGNQNAIAVMQSISDDFYILSETDSGQNNSKDFLLLKLDVSGNLIWSKYFGTTADDIPTDLKEMSNGKIMLCGYTYLNGANNTDVFLINIDTAGNIIWNKAYGGTQNEFAYKIAAASDSSVVVAGQTYSFGVTASSGYALKVSSIGNIVWSVTTSGAATNHTTFRSIDNTFDAGFILTGFWISTSLSYHTPVVKIDAFGNIVASNGYLINGIMNMSYDIKSIPGGDFIVVGRTNATADSGSVLVMRVNPPATSLSYTRIYASSDYEAASSVVLTPDGNFAFVGTGVYNNGFNFGKKAFLSKINLLGNPVYSNYYQPLPAYSSLNSIIVTHDNNLLSVGKIISPATSSSVIYVIKAALNNGASGCNENSSNFGLSSPFTSLTLGTNNNFGGLPYTITASMSSANVLQNDLCTTVVGFQELNINNESPSVFPNPSNGNFKITFNNNPSEKSIRIFDVRGNIIYEKEKIKNAEQEINLTTQSKGIYFLKIIDQDKTSVNKIVLK